MKSIKRLEVITKGVASKHRIAILFLLERRPYSDLDVIAIQLKIGYKTASEHLRKMHIAGLIEKEYESSYVLHSLTSRGKKLRTFLANLN